VKLALAASLTLLPGLAVTGIEQDVWLVRAHERWQVESPATYWAWTLISLVLLVVLVRRATA
jgi:hypothetical protein